MLLPGQLANHRERALRRGLKGYGAVPRRNRGLWLACQSWQMVLHPDEKAGEYACTRSSSIAVKLSANAIHTHSSLSVHVCVSRIFYHAGRKKKKPGSECTHKSHVQIRVSYGDVTGPPFTPPGAWRPLYPTLERVPQWPPGVAISLERCLSRHAGVLIGIQCLITGAGRCCGSPRAHVFGKTQSIRLKSGASVQACWEANRAQSAGRLHASSSASLPSTRNHAPHMLPDMRGFLKR